MLVFIELDKGELTLRHAQGKRVEKSEGGEMGCDRRGYFAAGARRSKSWMD